MDVSHRTRGEQRQVLHCTYELTGGSLVMITRSSCSHHREELLYETQGGLLIVLIELVEREKKVAKACAEMANVYLVEVNRLP